MSDITATINRYTDVCKEDAGPSSDFVLKVLKKEAENVALRNLQPEIIQSDESRDQMHLYLAGNNHHVTKVRLVDNDTLLLYKLLRTNTYVTSIDLRYNNITDTGAGHIAKLIEETPSLRDVNLMCNDFGEKGAECLAKALQTNETVTSLRLNGNKIGNRGGMHFASALQINTTLEALDLADTDLTTECVIGMAAILNYNRTLRALNMSRPILFTQQEETTVHFANALKVNLTLQELHLMKHDIRDFGVTRISENLMDNLTLTYLNLSCNRITRDGAKELAKLLRHNTPLKILDLGFNRLEDDGAMCLAEALATSNTHLTTLVVVSNCIKGKGLCALADSMKLNSTLSNIYIWGNNLEESACIAFSGLLETGRLEELDTDVKPYVVDGVTYLSQLSHGVRQYYYWGPSYGEQAIEDIAQFTSPIGRA